jgi:hypothetical protein
VGVFSRKTLNKASFPQSKMLTPFVPEGVLPFPLEILVMINREIFNSYRDDLHAEIGLHLYKFRFLVDGAYIIQLSVKVACKKVLIFAATKNKDFIGTRALKFSPNIVSPFSEPYQHEELDAILEGFTFTRALDNIMALTLY